MEKIINKRLQDYCESSNVFNKNQFGFRKNRSTEAALTLGYEYIARYRAKKWKVGIALRDVSKAFDRVWHSGLLWKLERTGCGLEVVKLIDSFLNNRSCAIYDGDATGDEFTPTAGVPQGAILSPTLYNIFVADIPEPHNKNTVNIIFADDITQISRHENTYQKLIKTEIENMNIFERKWKIKTNQKKFTLIKIDGKNTNTFHIHGQKYEYKKSGKFLGINFSVKGMKPGIQQRVAIANKTITQLKSKFRNLPSKKRKLLYTTLPRAQLYAMLLLSG